MKVLPFIANSLGYIGRVRVVLVVALLAFGILALPDQMLELYIIYAQAVMSAVGANAAGRSVLVDSEFQFVAQFAIGILCASLLSTLMWLSTLKLLVTSREPGGEHLDRPHLRHEITATLVSLLPVLALILGFSSAVTGLDEDGRKAVLLRNEQYWLNVGSTFLALVLAVNSLVYFLLLRRHALAFVDRLFSLRWFFLVCALLLAFSASIVMMPVALPSAVGTLALVLLFLSVLAYILTACASVTACHKVPVILPLAILAVGFSVYGLNDNHRVAHEIKNETPPTLETAFIEWFTQRKDKDHFEKAGVPYPIYLISAEGGGLYAAYHAASFLAGMQDQCPGFAQHAFGISSVSGGSLGSSVFAALASARAKNEGWRPCGPAEQEGEFKGFVQRYFAQDFLSPLIASTLFPDFLQRFLPVAFHELDRAKALEATFEKAWDGASGGAFANGFKGSLGDIWSTEKAAPGLFLNTTAITTGARVTLSHIQFGATPTALHISESLDSPCAGESHRTVAIPLATAVSLSARFPWLTPAGWLERPASDGKARTECEGRDRHGRRLYLADGGYFENSGLETAGELAARLRRVIELHPEVFPKGALSAEIVVIKILTADTFYARWVGTDADLSRSGPGELLTPIAALLNTRVARTRAVDSRTVFDRSFYRRSEYAEKTGGHLGLEHSSKDLDEYSFAQGHYRSPLNGTSFFLPLGWHLSTATRGRIEGQKSDLLDATRCLIRRDLEGKASPNWDERIRPCLPIVQPVGKR